MNIIPGLWWSLLSEQVVKASTQVVSFVIAFGSLGYGDNTRALVEIIVRSSRKGATTR